MSEEVSIFEDPLLAGLPVEQMGRRLGPTILTRKLGEGGMGAVYRGFHVNLDIDVAVKVLPAELAQRDVTFIERFYQEGRAAARLNHPNVVRVYDVAQQEEFYFLVMELVRGETAQAMLERLGVLPEPLAVEIVLGASEALRAAWVEKVIHRDVKPDNLLLTKDGTVKLADLGLAKVVREAENLDGGVTQVNMAMGSPHYCSPEQAQDARAVDHRADIYSLGTAFFHLLTGRVPFPGRTLVEIIMQVMTEPVPDARRFNPAVSQLAVAMIRRMMARDPRHRYQDYDLLIKDLNVLRPHDAAAARKLIASFVRVEPDRASRRLHSAAIPVPSQPYPPASSRVMKRETRALAAPVRRESGKAEGARPRRGVVFLGAALVLALALGGGYYQLVYQRPEAQALRALAAAEGFYRDHPAQLREALERFASVKLRWPETLAAEKAGARREELRQHLAEIERETQRREMFTTHFERGRKLAETGQLEAAEAEFRKAQQYLDNEQLRAALTQLSAKRAYLVALREGRRKLEEKDFAGALEQLLAAKQLGHTAEVEELLKTTRQEQAHAAWCAKGQEALRRGRWQEAHQAFQKALEQKTSLQATTGLAEAQKGLAFQEHLELAREHFRGGRYAQALAEAKKAHQCREEESARELIHQAQEAQKREQGYTGQMERGRRALAVQDFEAAEAAFQQALELKPGDKEAQEALVLVEGKKALRARARAFLAQGKILLEEGRPEAALAKFQEGLKVDPDFAELRLRQGQARFKLGRLEEADGDAAEFLKSDPADRPAQEAQDLRAQIAFLRQEAQRFAELVAQGDLAVQQGGYDQAVAAYREAQGISANKQVPLRLTAEQLAAKLEAAQAKQAEFHYARLLEQGDAALKAGQPEVALEHYREAAKWKNTDQVQARLQAARETSNRRRLEELCLEAEKLRAELNYAAALAKVREALQISPQHQPALALLAQLALLTAKPKIRLEDLKLELILIRPGKFMMGEKGEFEDRLPVREVEITQGFYLGLTPVTNRQYQVFVEASGHPPPVSSTNSIYNVWQGKTPPEAVRDHPVINVSHQDALAFCRWLTARERQAGRLGAAGHYTLPTEAQWEYAARASTHTPYPFGATADPKLAVYGRDWKKPQPTEKADYGHTNKWGLKGMCGNVWEWCGDWYDPLYYQFGPPKDPAGPNHGNSRVLRGGSWMSPPEDCTAGARTANREDYRGNVYGFRIARTLGE